jgi:hypothetical protein
LIAEPFTWTPGAGQQACARLDEVRAVALGVEGHDVRAEQPEQDLLPPRQAGENIRRRPGHMQEEPDGLIGQPFPDQPGNEHEVVVVNPRERARPLTERGQRPVGEGGVHLPVALPPGALKSWFLDRIMEQRPQRRVGEPVVVITELRAGQADRQQPDVEIGQRRGYRLRAAVPANPDAGVVRHDRPQRRDQPAGR